MMNYGTILVHEHEGPLESRYFSYDWEGPDIAEVPALYLRMHGYRNVREGHMLVIGPYKMRVIERALLFDGVLVQRGNPVASWLRYQRYRLARPLDSIYRRLILTAAVWGLAEYREYMIPSWHDLYVVKWFGRRRVD